MSDEVDATVAYIDGLWWQLGGEGEPPPLIVPQVVFDAALAAGFPASRMKVAPLFDETE